MASNPLIAQGTLNRLRGSVVVTDIPALNVTAPFLGREGISLALEGESTVQLPTLTGIVNSPEPYMMVSLTLTLLKTQALADQYKKQMEANSVVGDVVVTPDAITLGNYQLLNCSIESVRDLSFNGTSPNYTVVIKGYYNINNDLWNA